jgi:hypothetical protein
MGRHEAKSRFRSCSLDETAGNLLIIYTNVLPPNSDGLVAFWIGAYFIAEKSPWKFGGHFDNDFGEPKYSCKKNCE